VHPGSQLDHALRKTALQVHKELGLRHLSRIDFRVDSAERIWFLEANSLPGLTRKSLYPQSAAAAGVGFDNLLERLCHMAFDDGPVRVGGGDEQ
jgi:D-alanine-D-alanine ligase